MKKSWSFMAAVVLMVGCLWPSSFFPGQESASGAREQLQQYVTELKNEPDNQDLREKIISLALSLKPAPAVPGEAAELVGGGKYLMKKAKSKEDFADAARKFLEASNIGPWAANIYYNLGVAQQSAEQFEDAVKSFKLYLLAKPDADDREAVMERIGEAKAGAEQSSPEAVAERNRRESQTRAEKSHEEDENLIRTLDGSRYSCVDNRGVVEVLDIQGGIAVYYQWADPDRVPQGGRFERGRGPVNGREFQLELHCCGGLVQVAAFTISENGSSITEKRVRGDSRIAGDREYLRRQASATGYDLDGPSCE
jgi:tetratricopeptide (TPR) repeat protein